MSTLRELKAAIDEGAMVERVRTGERVMRFDWGYEYEIDTTSHDAWVKVCASFDELPPLLHDTDGWRVPAPVGLMYPELAHLRQQYEGWLNVWRTQCLAGEWKE